MSAFVSEDQIAMPRTLRRLRPLAEAAFTRVVARRLVARALPPGRAVDLLPPVPLPADLQWTSVWPVDGAPARGSSRQSKQDC